MQNTHLCSVCEYILVYRHQKHIHFMNGITCRFNITLGAELNNYVPASYWWVKNPRQTLMKLKNYSLEKLHFNIQEPRVNIIGFSNHSSSTFNVNCNTFYLYILTYHQTVEYLIWLNISNDYFHFDITKFIIKISVKGETKKWMNEWRNTSSLYHCHIGSRPTTIC